MGNRWVRFLFSHTAVAAVAFGSFLLLSGAPRLRADDDDCQRRIAHADHKLHEAIEHHGPRSKQAERARHDLQEAREWCWSRGHRWWDEDQRHWHTERDWDDHDHDRDFDRH